MELEKRLPADAAKPTHVCPLCARTDTVKLMLAGDHSSDRETWKCRECKHTWQIYVGPPQPPRAEERI
jgi:transposase-like protein